MIDYKKVDSFIAYIINLTLFLMYSGAFATSNLYRYKLQPYFINISNYMILIAIGVFIINYMYDKEKIIVYNKYIILFLITILVTTKIALNGGELDTLYNILVATAIYAMIMAQYFSVTYILEIFLHSQFIICIYTIFQVITNPSSALMKYLAQMVWRGGFSHKNWLAAEMCFGVIVCFCYYISDIKSKKLNNKFVIFTGILSSIILFKSGSKTSLLTLGLSLLMIFLYKYKKLKLNVTCLLLLINYIFYITVTTENILIKFIADILSRDVTLTGRTKIWQAVLDVIRESPIFGYGYINFWGRYEDLNAYIWNKAGFVATGSHNGFLEWLLLIGIVGVCVLIFNLINLGLKNKYLNNEAVKYLGIGYITFLLIYTMTERATDPLDFKIFILFLVLALTNKHYVSKRKVSINQGEDIGL